MESPENTVPRPRELQHLSYGDDLETLTRIAAWVGLVGRDDVLCSYTSQWLDSCGRTI